MADEREMELCFLHTVAAVNLCSKNVQTYNGKGMSTNVLFDILLARSRQQLNGYFVNYERNVVDGDH